MSGADGHHLPGQGEEMNLKNLSFVLGFLFMVISAGIGAVLWVDSRIVTAPFYPVERGMMLEKRIEQYEVKNDVRMDTMERQQRDMIESLGEIKGMLRGSK